MLAMGNSGSQKGMQLPSEVWNDEHILIPPSLKGAHLNTVTLREWHSEIEVGVPRSSGAIGGLGEDVAKTHFLERFFNSAARAEFVFADPQDKYTEIRETLLDQLGDGKVFVLDLGGGHGAGIMGILAVLNSLRKAHQLPRFPVNIYITAVDYSAEMLSLYDETLKALKPKLSENGIHLELKTALCDLKHAAAFSEISEVFFQSANNMEVTRFLCLISAVTGIEKSGVAQIMDSLTIAAAALAHSKRSSSWLWIEPRVKKTWHKVFGDKIELIFRRISHHLSEKSDAYSVTTNVPLIATPVAYEFKWRDPYQAPSDTVQGGVVVMAFKR